MVELTPSPIIPALVACAVFQTFDQPVLRAVLELDEEAAAALLRRDEVEAIAQELNTYRLRPAIQPAMLDELRYAHARDELHLHTRAFHYYLQRLREPITFDQDQVLEAACMHHLRALRDLYLDYRRPDEIEAIVDAVRAAIPDLQPHHRDQLTLFDAYIAMRRQKYQQSALLVRELLERSDLDPNLHAEALIIRGLGEMSQAHLERALTDFAAACELGAQIDDHIVQGIALIDQSWVYNDLYRFDKALQLSKQSLAHCQQAHDLYGAAFALYGIGNNAIFLGQWDIGMQHLDQAASIYERAGMTARLAMVDWARGLLHQVLGNVEASEQAYLRTLAYAESAEQIDIVMTTDTLTQLGLLYQTTGNWPGAAETLTRAIALAERLGDDQRRAALLHRYGLLRWQQDDPDQALALLAAAVECFEPLRVSTESEEIKISLLGTAQQVYESVVLAYLDRGDTPAAFGYIERARARAFLDLLARRNTPIDPFAQHQTVALHQLQAHLAPGTLLLEYYTIGLLPSDEYFLTKIPAANTQLRAQLIVPPEILLFAITADQVEVHRIAFDPNLLQPSPDDRAQGRQLFTERKLRWLYKELIAPVEHLLAGRSELSIIPHGPLHYVPFAALQKPDGATLLTRAGPALVYAPSATVLCACLEQPSSAEHLTAALGYDDQGAAALRFAEREARLVGQMLGGIVHVGDAPKSSALQQIAPQLRWLHIAGHAVYRADDPLGSYLRLGRDDNLDARTLMRTLKLDATIVTLNACASGLSHVASGDELLGLPRAFLYAGAATIICTLQEVDDLAASILMVYFYENLARGLRPAVAMHQAQVSLRTRRYEEVEELVRRIFGANGPMDMPSLDSYGPVPFAHPRYWTPFIVIGKP
jgi:CHAT domain-containing protein/tetratricopeptide (TPR) repeat protein